MGIEIQAVVLPTRRSLVDADNGAIDGLLNRIKEIESQHPNLIRVPVSIDEFPIAAISLSPNIRVETMQDMSKYRIGIRSGIRFAEVATHDMPRVTALREWNDIFDLLAKGRIDIILSTPRIWQEQKQRPRLSHLNLTLLPLKPVKLFHYLNRKHANLVPRLTKILTEMEQQGEIESIWRTTKPHLYKKP